VEAAVMALLQMSDTKLSRPEIDATERKPGAPERIAE
jgi:hypothetical protein